MTGSRCSVPGSLGRHVPGDPDWAGRTACDCGAVRRLPAGTHGLPEHRHPLLGFLDRLYADGITSLADFADELGLALHQVDAVHLSEAPA